MDAFSGEMYLTVEDGRTCRSAVNVFECQHSRRSRQSSNKPASCRRAPPTIQMLTRTASVFVAAMAPPPPAFGLQPSRRLPLRHRLVVGCPTAYVLLREPSNLDSPSFDVCTCDHSPALMTALSSWQRRCVLPPTPKRGIHSRYF
jgi:hypothetical protein